MDLPWRLPVTVRLLCGSEKTFLSVHDALDFLANEWPLRRGERYDRALRKCRAALRRLVPLEVAREAFIAACFEAGMPMVMSGPLRFSVASHASAMA
jgi:hypothetical protein